MKNNKSEIEEEINNITQKKLSLLLLKHNCFFEDDENKDLDMSKSFFKAKSNQTYNYVGVKIITISREKAEYINREALIENVKLYIKQ